MQSSNSGTGLFWLAVEFNLTNTYPPANNMSLDGVDLDGQYLFQPMLKVFGYKVRNLNGSEAESGFSIIS